MKNFNIIVVLDETEEKVLLCKRRKEPYKGLSNFVGGKIEPGEDGLQAAYRELWEETSITKEDIQLFHFMDFIYHHDPCRLEVYVGKLNGPVTVKGDENKLYWESVDEDMFDAGRFAGQGNMGHIMSLIRQLPGVSASFLDSKK